MAISSAGLMISAPRKSSGKTTLTLGVSAALIEQGCKVRVFKKGPDYIDPMWHHAVTGLPCYNIDSFWMDDDECCDIFNRYGREAELNIVEGNHGLHDGLDLTGKNSGAHLAKLLKIPVILVVDSSGMNRGVAAIVLGHQKMDPDVQFGGVILNNVASQRQAQKQVAAIEHYCNIPVLGTLPRTAEIQIKERHLGLTTTHEISAVKKVVLSIAEIVKENCDLDKIKSAANILSISETRQTENSFSANPKVRIAVAYDKSFCFYYEENFNALKRAGAELVYFDTLSDQKLPDVDGIYIGGGFPESFLPELEDNQSLRNDIKLKVDSGVPTYAECGGLMYLAKSIEREGLKKEMVGIIPADVLFQKKPVGKGYVELNSISKKSWFNTSQLIKGHEFHYSRLINIGSDIEYNYRVKRGTGINGEFDGIVYKNLLASYAHIHSSCAPGWAKQFVDAAAKNSL